MTRQLNYKEELKKYEITSTKKGAETAKNGAKYENGIATILNQELVNKKEVERWSLIRELVIESGYNPEALKEVYAKRLSGNKKEDVIMTLVFIDNKKVELKISVKGTSHETQFGLNRINVFLSQIDCHIAKEAMMFFLGDYSKTDEIKNKTGQPDRNRMFKSELERKYKKATVSFFNSESGIKLGLDIIFGSKGEGIDIIIAPKNKWCYDENQLMVIGAKKLRRRMETIFKPEYNNFLESSVNCINPDELEKILILKKNKNGKLITPDSEGKIVLANILSLKRRGGSNDPKLPIKGSDAQFNCSVKALYELDKLLDFLE